MDFPEIIRTDPPEDASLFPAMIITEPPESAEAGPTRSFKSLVSKASPPRIPIFPEKLSAANPVAKDTSDDDAGPVLDATWMVPL